jgi:Ni2+-binding GTPase involved in maturation of urease and hydrogenase
VEIPVRVEPGLELARGSTSLPFMDLHLVGGFLGSGKTTAIAAAANQLLLRGRSVGVVTNDQGQILVDTEFLRSRGLPTVQVAGSCFCCNFNELVAKLDELSARTRPDVVFAESVGSCADMVGTILRPLLEFQRDRVTVTSFSVFVDVRLLLLHLTNQPLPFSHDIQYVFAMQLEEASLLVLNHCDEVPAAEARLAASMARRRFPGRAVRLQNSLDPDSVAGWLDLITSGTVPLPAESPDIDYQRYGAGEAELAWLDERVALRFPEGRGRAVVVQLLEGIVDALRREQIPLGHLKCVVEAGSGVTKISFIAFESDAWRAQVAELPGTSAMLLLNLRAEAEASRLRTLVAAAVQQAGADGQAACIESDVSAFHPGFPKPTHRLA